MSIETWITYIFAYSIVVLSPGPSVFMVLAQTLTNRLPAAMLCILGNTLGDLLIMAVTFAGMGVLMVNSPELFQVIKWAGVAYLGYLGVSQIVSALRRRSHHGTLKSPKSKPVTCLRIGFLTGSLNPKTGPFYLAFLIQFIDPDHAVTPQIAVLMISSALIGFGLYSGYAVLASQAKRVLGSSRAQTQISYVSGSFFLFGSAMIAAT